MKLELYFSCLTKINCYHLAFSIHHVTAVLYKVAVQCGRENEYERNRMNAYNKNKWEGESDVN